MKLRETIRQVNELKANAYTEDTLTGWIMELENYVIEDIFNRAEGMNYEPVTYSWEENDDQELMIPDPYSEVYIHYLCTKIDYWNREMDSYNNSVSMYNAAYQNFANRMRRKYKPKSSRNRKIMLH